MTSMNMTLSTYFQENVPIESDVQMFKIQNFPKPPGEYKSPNVLEILNPSLRVTFPTARLLNKRELSAKEIYIKDICCWIENLLNKIIARHAKEMEMTQKQLQIHLDQIQLTKEKKEVNISGM